MCWRIGRAVFLSSTFLACLLFAQNPAAPIAPSSNDGRSEGIQLIVNNPLNVKYPAALADRILRNTVRALALRLNSSHPPPVVGQVMLRLGVRGFTVETTHPKGGTKRTVITMERWDEALFARMSARAARDSLLSEADLDDCARSGLTAAGAIATVNELRQGP